jgi:hypothetical protein
VLGRSRADGIFLVPEYRGSSMAAILDEVRGGLHEVISFADWDAFCASGSPAQFLPDVDPGSAATDPVHVGHDRAAEGRRPASPRDRQQR